MSRITINLKKSVYKVNEISHIRPELPSIFSQKSADLKVDCARVKAPGLVDSHPKRAAVGHGDMVQASRFAGEGECDDGKLG
jgi:hypothetical protein